MHPSKGLQAICYAFGKSRQGYYKHLKAEKEQLYQEAVIVKLISVERIAMPRLGGSKLFFLLKAPMLSHGIDIGRDKFYNVMYDYGLKVRRRRRRKPITTDSNHPFKKYPNLIKGLFVTGPNQLWVSDITYIPLIGTFCYLSLITDSYSRKIVGYCLYPTLQRFGPLSALKRALKDNIPASTLIHHSDRGLQYCCSDYTEVLSKNKVTISMTEKGDPYENALAERVNGILKCEFLLDRCFKNFQEASRTVADSIRIYNEQRPHSSCDYLTPEQAHQKSGVLAKRWRSTNAGS